MLLLAAFGLIILMEQPLTSGFYTNINVDKVGNSLPAGDEAYQHDMHHDIWSDPQGHSCECHALPFPSNLPDTNLIKFLRL
ncbi:hypothetical protein TNCT_10651 [Trichonephila clavata]|uniref:Uncharacterized protein n=1 Tax=Trichonephila clavata TaxID=2740835 RepID=A0A8X6FE62_TRICU|nr:hypothetical protein TNCT_10651 [Trichonephila clavata]